MVATEDNTVINVYRYTSEGNDFIGAVNLNVSISMLINAVDVCLSEIHSQSNSVTRGVPFAEASLKRHRGCRF